MEPVLFYGVSLVRLVEMNSLRLPEELGAGKKINLSGFIYAAKTKKLDVLVTYYDRRTIVMPEYKYSSQKVIFVHQTYVGEKVKRSFIGMRVEAPRFEVVNFHSFTDLSVFVDNKSSILDRIKQMGLNAYVSDLAFYGFLKESSRDLQKNLESNFVGQNNLDFEK